MKITKDGESFHPQRSSFTIDQSYEGVEFASGEIFSVPSTSTTSIEIDLPANFYVSDVIIKHINDPEPTA
jgi:uncharacterized protein YaiE (UPF0345 family)